MESTAAAVVLLVAFWIDRAFGEPPTRWHPVGWMGRYLGWIGAIVGPRDARVQPDWRSFTAGALAWWGGALLSLLAALLLLRGSFALGEVVGVIATAVALKAMLSWRMLREETAAVEAALQCSLDEGRRRLGYLVSRDVMRLSEAEVRESAIESLAENLNDSVVAPVFWFLVAGLPGAVVYRFANTADAMWGYRGRRAGVDWTWAGKWAARADDVLSWIPARLTAALIALVAGGVAWTQLRQEAGKTPSPNGGWPMGAMALALDTRLGKPGAYLLHAAGRTPTAADARQAVRLAGWAVRAMLAGGVLVMLACGAAQGWR